VFRAKTLFVIGAGASVEVGLPVGIELLRQIVNLTDIRFDHYQQQSGDRAIVAALKILLKEGSEVEKLNAHLAAGWQLAKSAKQAISIDNVIDALEDPKIELVGKLGIVRAILKAEADSPFFKMNDKLPKTLDMSRFDGTWYSGLTQLLTENVRRSEIGALFENFQVINFNYDRCLEHYLPFSLADYYGIELTAIREIMQTLVVHRPYGIAGKLPWQKGEGQSVEFGGGDPNQLAAIAQQVRTFTERVEEGDELESMKVAVANADRIIFLGFAFHRQNVELLAQKVQSHTEIVGTTLGISESDKSVIDTELTNAFGLENHFGKSEVELANSTCHQFFKEYWRTLTAAKSAYERASFDLPELPTIPSMSKMNFGGQST
jgi:hypothetical protein